MWGGGGCKLCTSRWSGKWVWRQCEWTVKWVQTSGEDGKVGEQAFKTDKHLTPPPGSHTPVNLKTSITL